ncbi:MAG TPA: UPF0175 family protein [Bryobacteraceae bacterium]|nr:UPF0175 family protein [Bryobacteraceae bacterium]
MILSVEIPDELSAPLNALGGDLPRRALEGLALEEYRRGRLAKNELRKLLGFETRYEVDAFLKEHNVEAPYSMADFDREIRNLEAAGL